MRLYATYRNSEMIVHNADLFICQAFDNDLMTQSLGLFIRMLQNTEIVIAILFVIFCLAWSSQVRVIIFSGEIIFYCTG